MKKLFLYLFLITLSANAQITVKGYITEKDGKSIPGVNIKVLKIDSSLFGGTASDENGYYKLSLPASQKFILQFNYIGFKRVQRQIETSDSEMDIGRIVLKPGSNQLEEVEVVGLQQRGEQKGDTTSFNADAFKTNPDASAEDLIKKMPGVTSDNSGVKVNGEEVKRVLVDGKPFFGEDPNAALKNLPAEIIEKVEVFDKMSEQSQFSGFNDGDQQKAINFVTKRGKNMGQFGRIYGGVGGEESGEIRYSAGGNINSFKDKQRVSLLFLSNNINQQNFSTADIMGAMGSSGGGRRGDGGSRGSFSGGSSSLLTAPQNGISATQALGLNYSDEWGKKTTISGSYFFNFSDNINEANQVRNYFGKEQLIYSQNNTDNTINLNHRFNVRLEHNIDSVNKIIFTPNFTYQKYNLKSELEGNNKILEGIKISETKTKSKAENDGYDFAPNLLFQHKFKKRGRTVSVNLNTKFTENINEGKYYSRNIFTDTTSGLDQEYNTYGNTKKYSANISYTEPITEFSQVELKFNPSYYEGSSDKETDDYSKLKKQYVDFNPSLSNKYFNIYTTQRAGLSYKYNKNKLNVTVGSDIQQSNLQGDQSYPVAFGSSQSFRNILPHMHLNYKFSKSKNLRMHYRSSTNIPSLLQLQNVLDVTNPLQVSSGNTSLKQTNEQYLSMRFGGFDMKTSRNAMIFLNCNIINDYISTANYTIRKDTIIQNFEIKAGSQLSKPVNLDNYLNLRSFFTYGFPIKVLKSNINVNGGLSYSHLPGLNNEVLNYADNYTGNGGVFMGSNINQNIDFSIGYNGYYNVVKNTVQVQSDNSYFNHVATFKLNLIIKNAFVINTDISHSLYNGLNQSFDQVYMLWNAYLGYKFGTKKNWELKASVFDLLKQNRSISRTITSNYTEDNNSTVLQRYGMITLTYTLRNFKKGQPPKNEDSESPYREMFKNRGMHMPGRPPF
ncbi:MAG: TonB-dependent receptor [Sphingobacteriaceae bacterium]|nr:TonB-dependent receptor [Sphingobacteriaceae bacterium]